MTDIDRLHRLFLNENECGRCSGHTTLFAWQLIGIAQLNCFDWQKIKQQVWIPFSKPHLYVFDIIRTVGRICNEEHIDFCKNDKHQFAIYHTVFEFYNVRGTTFGKRILPPEGYDYWFCSYEDNDALWQDYEQNNDDMMNGIVAAISGVSIIQPTITII